MDQLLTRAEAAQHLGVHVNTVDNYRRIGLIAYIKVRGMVRIRLEDVDAFLAKHRTPVKADVET